MRGYRINLIDKPHLANRTSALEGRMEAIVGILTAAIVGGTAVFCYTMYLTSGSESDHRSKRQI
jgi:hypothetical protein